MTQKEIEKELEMIKEHLGMVEHEPTEWEKEIEQYKQEWKNRKHGTD